MGTRHPANDALQVLILALDRVIVHHARRGATALCLTNRRISVPQELIARAGQRYAALVRKGDTAIGELVTAANAHQGLLLQEALLNAPPANLENSLWVEQKNAYDARQEVTTTDLDKRSVRNALLKQFLQWVLQNALIALGVLSQMAMFALLVLWALSGLLQKTRLARFALLGESVQVLYSLLWSARLVHTLLVTQRSARDVNQAASAGAVQLHAYPVQQAVIVT